MIYSAVLIIFPESGKQGDKGYANKLFVSTLWAMSGRKINICSIFWNRLPRTQGTEAILGLCNFLLLIPSNYSSA